MPTNENFIRISESCMEQRDELRPYTYELPRECIAQRPVEPRDSARMLVVDRAGSSLSFSTFVEFHDLVRRGDLLVVNDTRVRPARLFGEITSTGGGCELLLLTPAEIGEASATSNVAPDIGVAWWCIGRPMKRFAPGTSLIFPRGLLGTIVERRDTEVRVRFSTTASLGGGDPGIAPADRGVRELLAEVGTMPIPPYIREGHGDLRDREDYQSIFARLESESDLESSVAAPTASLHFTESLLARIRAAGCEVATVTLHVGLASVRPLFREGEGKHARVEGPGIERYRYDPTLVEHLREVRARGGRVIGVGTTVVRALESMVRAETSHALPVLRETDLFISPGFSFRAIDAMVTNFHQSGSSHLLLVESFMGRALLDRSYQEALGAGMRFLSYGDGMLIL